MGFSIAAHSYDQRFVFNAPEILLLVSSRQVSRLLLSAAMLTG